MMKVTEAFEMFVDEQLFRNNSPKTLIWYRENLGAFFRWLGVDSSIDDLTIFNYKAYCSYLLHEYEHNGKPLKSSSVNSHVRCVKAFYNFCIQEDLIPDFSRKLKTTKVHKTEKLPLDDEEINLLLQSFGDTVLERRNFCWVVLMCDSGLRRGEILSLIMKNVDLNHDFLLVTGKGCKQRFVPLGQLSHIALYDYISRYRSGAGGSDPVFVDRFGNACNANTIKQVFQKLKKCTGIDRLHPHLLRHTFATNYLVDGGDLETLRLILGHSELNPLLNDTGRLSTLLHEVGHELLHFSANSNKMSIEQKEIEADIFSMLMLRRYGFEIPDSRSKHFVDNYRSLDDKDGKLLQESFDRVMKEYSKTVQLISTEFAEEMQATEEVSNQITMVMG